VIGFRRHPASESPGVREVSIDALDDWLPRADHVVNILPASRETEDFFNADRFARFNRSAAYWQRGTSSWHLHGGRRSSPPRWVRLRC